ncbi:MAG: large conductance mechanosensitive channel protein MscL [Clostridia bacterium]|nr:large conductance mechanosensitive channel protein MscL [Clostridia bacterium]
MLKEFKKFATKGNIMDLAVGVVIGGAFQSIINSLVNDIIMPAISIITGKVDFSDMMFTVGEASIKYGNFITAIVNFLIIAFSIFLAITYMNKLSKKMEAISLGQVEKINKKLGRTKKEEPAPEPTVKICPFCYSEIPYKATRCAHCTSELEKVESK